MSAPLPTNGWFVYQVAPTRQLERGCAADQSPGNLRNLRANSRIPHHVLLLPPEALVFHGALLDFELAEDGMPADVDFVPLGLEIAQGAFAHLAEDAKR